MDLDLSGQQVQAVTSDYAVTLVLSGGATVRIETKLTVSRPGEGDSVIDPQGLVDGFDLQATLVGCTIARGAADNALGSLVLLFEEGTRLDVAPDDDYEAWSIGWPDGSLLVSLPGGGVSEWGPRT